MEDLLKYASVASLVVPFFIWALDQWKKRKQVTIEVTYDKRILTPKEEQDGITVRHDNKTIPDPYLVIIQVENSGFVPIKDGDYQAPLTITFGPSAQVVAVHVDDYSRPEVVKDTVRKQVRNRGSSVSIANIMLNPKDTFFLRVLVSHYGGYTIDGHIEGAHIRKGQFRRVASTYYFIFAGLLIVYGVLFAMQQIWIASHLSVFASPFVAVVGLLLRSRTAIEKLGPHSK